MLRFIGNGSCFNTKATNTSAYYYDVQNSRLLLFDCGESVFEKILNSDLLNGVKDILVFITHFHSDHIGSLPSLIFYCNIVLKIKPTIIYPKKDNLEVFLRLSGVPDVAYYNVQETESLQYTILQEHTPYLDSYGYVVEIGGKTVYYSGDCKVIPKKVMQLFEAKAIDFFYQDVSRHDTIAHMNILDLSKQFSVEKRSLITVMHFDDEETITMATDLGFLVASSI